MGRTAWERARVLGGAAILTLLVWRVGTGPFVDGIRRVSAPALLAAAAITAVTTVCSAWRWRVVSRGLGIDLPLGTAVAAYYRSQLLNGALPGGVVGDVHRGVRQGRNAGEVCRGLRAVAWERSAGQVVQAVLAVGVLLLLDSPVHGAMPRVAWVAVLLALCTAVLLRTLAHRGSSRAARLARAVVSDLRAGFLDRRAWPAVTLASAVVVVGHTATFLIAVRTSGPDSSPALVLPMAMLVLLAMAVPVSVGGWGPREGVAAWAFAAAGLGADRGVTAATAYGVLALAATSPGAVVLLRDALRRRPSRTPQPNVPRVCPAPVLLVSKAGASDG